MTAVLAFQVGINKIYDGSLHDVYVAFWFMLFQHLNTNLWSQNMEQVIFSAYSVDIKNHVARVYILLCIH